MVREVKVSTPDDEFDLPVCRDSILDEILPLVVPRGRRRSTVRRRRQTRPPRSANPTPRRDLAAANDIDGAGALRPRR